MKPSREFMSGFLLGLRSPFGLWSEVGRSMHIDLTPRYRNTLSDAWLETGRLLRQAEHIEVESIEKAAPAAPTRERKEAARGDQRLHA